MAKRYETHKFLCLNCGQEGIPLSRRVGHQHGRFHRKKLYCVKCKTDINHVECKTEEEVRIFKEAFEKGEFVNEAKESISSCRCSCVW